MSSKNSLFWVIFLVITTACITTVICDGDHAHAHEASATAGTAQTAPTGPTGTVTTIHSSTGDPGAGGGSAFSSILSSLSPELIRNLAGNPQVVSALRSNGIDPSVVAAAASAGGNVVPPGAGGAYDLPPSGGYDYPPPPRSPGFGGGFPGFGFGPYKSLHVSGNYGLFYPYVEKAIIIFGGGILILVILALLLKASAKGGLLYNFGSSISEAMSGAASLDIGPIHKSVAGAAAVSASGGGPRFGFGGPDNLQLTQNVQDSLDRRF